MPNVSPKQTGLASTIRTAHAERGAAFARREPRGEQARVVAGTDVAARTPRRQCGPAFSGSPIRPTAPLQRALQPPVGARAVPRGRRQGRIRKHCMVPRNRLCTAAVIRAVLAAIIVAWVLHAAKCSTEPQRAERARVKKAASVSCAAPKSALSTCCVADVHPV